jgi:2-C-methyl-D-erythritol 4-phosphate cytidylyltransferase
MVVIAEGDEYWQVIMNALKTNQISKNSKLNLEKEVRFCIGGQTRMDSVLAGLSALSNESLTRQWVLVHDAARPGVNQETLNNYFSKLNSDSVIDGYVLGQNAVDTIKISSAEGVIKSTLNRSKIWAAQTPQAFHYQPLIECLQAINNNTDEAIQFTDESSAMEQSGARVQLINGNRGNFKITTTDDIDRMECELKHQFSASDRIHPKQFFNPITELAETI